MVPVIQGQISQAEIVLLQALQQFRPSRQVVAGGFEEAAEKRLVFQYTTSSTSLQKKLGVA